MEKIFSMVMEISRKEVLVDKRTCAILGIVTFALLTGMGAYLRMPLPFTPVPFTLQTLFVLLGGAILGSRKGIYSQLLGIVLGSVGITAFAGGHNLLVIFGPTGGYLLGFILAAGLVGFLHSLNEKPSILFTIWAMSLGEIVLLGTGAFRLSHFVGGFQNAFSLGVLPFVPGDIIKIFMAALIYIVVAERSKEIFYN